MLHVVYDGSLNGDWICDYALSMAEGDPERSLRILHVQDGEADPERVAQRFAELRRACEERGISFDPQLLPQVGGVLETLAHQLPQGELQLVLCGARLYAGRKGFLRGTISDRLLRLGRHHVIALRVVKPGLLGIPRRLLIPLSGHPRGIDAVWPFLSRLVPLAEKIQLLRVMPLSLVRFTHLSRKARDRLKAQGWGYLNRVLADARARCENADIQFDARVVVSDAWPREILEQASRFQAEMLMLGASERLLRMFSSPIEQILADAPCDVGVCRGP